MVACPRCRTRYPDGTSACAADGEALVADDQVPPIDTDLQPGTVVGEYRIEGKLGEGGFGAVYKAVHPVIGKAAAIKVLGFDFSSNPEMVSRFVAEARAVNQIRHKNIIDVFSFGRLPDGRQYYVMELLSGTTLDAYYKERGCLSIEEAWPILKGILRALGAAHAGGIAHRDLKPENVFLVFDEDGGVMPKLIDFGIAKLLGDDGAAGHKTRTGTPMGTPYYMSPEQCRGKNVDHRTDIYSLGVLTFVLLTGKRPFMGESMMDILLKHIMEPAPRLSSALPSAPKELDAAVAALLEKDPAKRPQSAAEAVSLLDAAVKGLSLEALRLRGGARGPDGDRVSIGGGGMSAAEAETAHTVATGPSAVPNTRSDTIKNSGPPADMQNGTLEPASRDTGSATTPGVPSAMPKKRAWVPFAALGAAVLGAVMAVGIVMASGKGAPSGAASGAGSAGQAASAEAASPAETGPQVVPVGEAGGKAATATATTTAATTTTATATATATGKAGVAPKTAAPAGTSAPKTTGASTGKPPSPKGDKNDLSY